MHSIFATPWISIVYNGPKIFVVWFTSISIGCLSSAEQIFLTNIYLLKECTDEERLSMQSKIYCFVISNTLIIMYFTNLFIFLNNHNGCYSQKKNNPEATHYFLMQNTFAGTTWKACWKHVSKEPTAKTLSNLLYGEYLRERCNSH